MSQRERSLAPLGMFGFLLVPLLVLLAAAPAAGQTLTLAQGTLWQLYGIDTNAANTGPNHEPFGIRASATGGGFPALNLRLSLLDAPGKPAGWHTGCGTGGAFGTQCYAIIGGDSSTSFTTKTITVGLGSGENRIFYWNIYLNNTDNTNGKRPYDTNNEWVKFQVDAWVGDPASPPHELPGVLLPPGRHPGQQAGVRERRQDLEHHLLPLRHRALQVPVHR